MYTRIYLHIPFCVSRCGYCAFNSQKLQNADLREYGTLLLNEMKLSALAASPSGEIESIYFGGGTPSLMEPEMITVLLENAADLFGLGSECEITVEANPGTVAQKRLAAYRRVGVNRLSLGFQSFDDGLLKSLGRIHNAKEARSTFNEARRAGFDNIGIDLMHSLPGEGITKWQSDLEEAVRLSPEHISVYGLTIEEKTPFFYRYPVGTSELPDEDLSADMYEMAYNLLTEAGYDHYEIANYARPGFSSRHNNGYWRRDGYLGLGAGAHSFYKDGNGLRYSNESSLADYSRIITAAQLPRVDMRRLSADEAMAEFLFLGLRMSEGIKPGEFSKEFGQSLTDVYGGIPVELVESGLLAVKGDSIHLTRRGMMLSNQVFARFV